MTLENLSLTYVRELRKLYPEDEAISIKNLVFMFVMACDRLNLTVRKKEIVSSEANKQLTKFLERLMKHEPVHYVLGETWFYGMKMKVNPSVLIPRPETEFLVDLIIREQKHKPNLHILDICTGSGCIAIALKKNLNDPQVEAWDISQEALNTAKINAEINNTKIDFIETDILIPEHYSGQLPFDFIVSNPPYVRESEKENMRPNVLDYEPALALFVPDNDPLLFYRAIAQRAKRRLKEKGRLYFEIHESQGEGLTQMMIQAGYVNVRLHIDSFDKVRYLVAEHF